MRGRLARLEPPGNWRERHVELLRRSGEEQALVREVWSLHHRRHYARARAVWSQFASMSQAGNTALADEGYRDCAGRPS